MRVLVTGGAGFIGANLVQALVGQGAQVVVLDNLSSGYRGNLQGLPLRDFVEADIRDEEAVHRASVGCGAVFHLAASVGNKRSLESPEMDLDVNARGTLIVLEAARAHRVPSLVMSSSAGVYGELTTLPISEGHPLNPDSPYGCSKLYAERLALAYGRLYGTHVVCLRYFNVYGPLQRYDAYGNVIPVFAEQLSQGRDVTVYGDGEQTRDFVHVRDVVRANILGAEARSLPGVYNIGSSTQVTINRLVSMMEEAFGLDAHVVHGPPRAGDVRDSLADVSAARNGLGYMPTVPLEQGLGEYASWFMADGRRIR